MADFTQIIQEINDDINTNGVGAITGAKLNEVLRDMIAAVNAEKQDPLTIDATPTEDSTNPVQSGGVYSSLQQKPTIFYTPDIMSIPPTILNRLQVGDIVRYGNNETVEAIVVVTDIENGVVILVTNDGTNISGYQYQNGLLLDVVSFSLADMATKVGGAVNGHLAGLDSIGNLTDSGKSVSDFATAAQGTKADTAYQKPASGIPASDLASAVQTSLGKADTALQSYTETDPVFSASPAAGITSGDIADWDGKAEPIEIVDASTPPMTMQPDKVYQYGTLSGDTTFPLLLFINDGKAHIHCWTFATPSTAPTITWPSAITSWAGGSAPTINASKSYEVSVMDGFATIIEN